MVKPVFFSVHLHMVIPPKDAVAKVVATLKSVTSTRMKEKFPQFLGKVYLGWSRDLGTRIFREYGGHQRSDHPTLCSVSG